MTVHEMPFDVRVRWDDHATDLTAPEVDRRVKRALSAEFAKDDAWLDVDALVALPKPKQRMHGRDCVCGCQNDDQPITGEVPL